MNKHELHLPLDPSLFSKVSGRYGLTNSPWSTANPHTGVDFAAPIGSNVYAVEDGTIANVYQWDGKSSGAGTWVCQRIDWSPYEWLDTRNYHCSQIVAKQGQAVKKGDIIAKSGNTGNVAIHFHITMWFRKKGDPIDDAHKTQVDPLKVFSGEILGVYTPLNYWDTNMAGDPTVKQFMANLSGNVPPDTAVVYETNNMIRDFKGVIKDWVWAFYTYNASIKNFHIESMIADLAKKDEVIVTKQTLVDSLSKELGSTKTSLSNMTIDRDKYLDQVGKLNSEIVKINEANKLAIKILDDQLAERDKTIKTLTGEKTVLTETNERLQTQLDELKASQTIVAVLKGIWNDIKNIFKKKTP